MIPVEIKGLRLQVVESGLNEPTGHVWQADPSQYSSILHDVHEVEVASPPGLNEPTGHVWQVDPSQYSFAAHHVLIGLHALTQRVAAWLFDTPQ